MARTMAAVVNLNHQGHYIHWGFIQISVANLVVIALMLLVFALALVLPFPHHEAEPPGGPAAAHHHEEEGNPS